MTSPEHILERYRQGVVSPDDAADYFYKRHYPRRYRWLQSAPRRAERCRHNGSRGLVGLIADCSSFILDPVLGPLFAAHYRRVTAQMTATLRAGDLPRPPHRASLPRTLLPTALLLALTGCIGRDIDRSLSRSGKLIAAASAYHHANGRYPQTRDELHEGAALCAVKLDTPKLKRLRLENLDNGGVRIHWAEQSEIGLRNIIALGSSLSGNVELPAPKPTTRPTTAPTSGPASRPASLSAPLPGHREDEWVEPLTAKPRAQRSGAPDSSADPAMHASHDKLRVHSTERLERLLELGILSPPAAFAARGLLDDRRAARPGDLGPFGNGE